MVKYEVSGEKIKEMREKAGLTTRRLGDLLGFCAVNNLVNKWERGERGVSVNNLYRIAEILGCDADELVIRKVV